MVRQVIPTTDRQFRKRNRDKLSRKKKFLFEPGSAVPNATRPGNRHRLNHITLDSERGGVEFKVRTLPRKLSSIKALNIRSSKRWIKNLPCPGTEVLLPFISKVGKFTGTNLYKCSLQPQSAISIIISTIFRRLKFWSLRRNSVHDVDIMQNILVKCAAYYALSKNEYFIDRILALSKVNLRKNKSLISKILHFYTTKLDDHKWFVYGHVCLQTYWLTSRALRPRDKSAFNDLDFLFRSGITGAKERAQFTYNSIWSCCLSMTQI